MHFAEVWRRLVHVAGAIFPILYLLDGLTWHQLELLYIIGSAVAIGLETVRLVVGFDWWVFHQLTRDYEAANPAGYALYTVSSAIVILVFPPQIAIPAVLILAIADPVSGLLAANEFGEPKRPVVLVTTFLISGAIALAFVPPGSAVLGAVAVTAADGFTPVIAGYVIDDNITIPIGAALAMWIGLRWLPPVAI